MNKFIYMKENVRLVNDNNISFYEKIEQLYRKEKSI